MIQINEAQSASRQAYLNVFDVIDRLTRQPNMLKRVANICGTTVQALFASALLLVFAAPDPSSATIVEYHQGEHCIVARAEGAGAMAGEYSRELSAKVFAGQSHLSSRQIEHQD